jgi:hypothetical protein
MQPGPAPRTPARTTDRDLIARFDRGFATVIFGVFALCLLGMVP